MVELAEANGDAEEVAAAAAVVERSPDRETPLSFVAERHLEAIEGVACVTQTWRMKERVSRVGAPLRRGWAT